MRPKDEYPINLMKDISGSDAIKYKSIDEIPSFDIYLLERSLDILLNERTIKILKMYYKDKMTFEQIAKLYNVTISRVRNIKIMAINKLKRFESTSLNLQPKDTDTVDSIFFNMKIVHSLEKYGIFTIKDLKNLTKKEIKNIRGMGDSSIKEFNKVLNELGIELKEK